MASGPPLPVPFPPQPFSAALGQRAHGTAVFCVEFGASTSWCPGRANLQSGRHSKQLITLLLGQAPWVEVLQPRLIPPRSTWWEEGGDTYKLSSELHMCAVVVHTHMLKK